MRALLLAFVLGCGGRSEPPQNVTIEPLPLPTATAPVVIERPAPPPKPATALAIAERDTRQALLRVPALVQAEIQGLESLFATTASSSPDRPQLLRRLAEDYVEQRKTTGAGGKEAIDRYKMLVDQYPNYPLMDNVLYYLGLEYELAKDPMNARRVYYELIQKHPASKRIPGAYFAFGEMFFDEGKGDPSKLDYAKQAYNEVLKFSGDPLVPWALWRLGQAFDALGDSANARKAYTRLTTDFPQSEAAKRAP